MEGRGSRSMESNTKRKKMEVTMCRLQRKKVKMIDEDFLWAKVPPEEASQSAQRDLPMHGRAPKGLMIIFSLASFCPQGT